MELEPGEDMNLIREDKKTGAKIEVFGKTISDEHWVLVKSEHKRLKEEAMAMRTETILLERLQYLRDGLNKKNRIKLYSSVLQSIGRLKEKDTGQSCDWPVLPIVEVCPITVKPRLRSISKGCKTL